MQRTRGSGAYTGTGWSVGIRQNGTTSRCRPDLWAKGEARGDCYLRTATDLRPWRPRICASLAVLDRYAADGHIARIADLECFVNRYVKISTADQACTAELVQCQARARRDCAGGSPVRALVGIRCWGVRAADNVQGCPSGIRGCGGRYPVLDCATQDACRYEAAGKTTIGGSIPRDGSGGLGNAQGACHG